ncbi:MAG: urea ABC transporter permease subunit UrtB [Aquabacterium sp.]
MTHGLRRLLRAWALLWLVVGLPVQALTPEQAGRIAAGDNDERIAALHERMAAADTGLLPLLQALRDDAVKVSGGRAWVVRDGQPPLMAGGAAVPLPADAEDVVNNNRMRREIDGALAALALLSPDLAQRSQALQALSRDDPDPARAPLLERALAAETDPAQKARLARLLASLRIASPVAAERVAAAAALATSADPGTRALLLQRLQAETDAGARAALQTALDQVQRRLTWGERLGVLFTGLSLGSVLLLAALGLAITYGLMGVINMAHGELIMIGAYATWGVQNLFRAWWPGGFDAYIVVALPASFLASAAVGVVIERLVIRHLYGRPLETLLATWGISLILMQTVRSLFGAQNVPVENPGWLSGGVTLLPNLVLPYSRIAIIVFAALVVAGVALLIARTRLGLYVRAVTGNRRMAACVGVDTARVDTAAFALGAGIAGLAGCALSQIGNVGPDLGASTIVDSFMVVVLGGVGQLAGTVVAGLGLGVANKLLEGAAGAVLAKIVVLLFIVVFIQKRPQGLFALKGRSAE